MASNRAMRARLGRYARTLHRSELQRAWERNCAYPGRRVESTIWLDNRYQVLPDTLWKEVVRHDRTDRRKPTEFYDSDDYALRFKAMVSAKLGLNSVGLVIAPRKGAEPLVLAALPAKGGSQPIRFLYMVPETDRWVCGTYTRAGLPFAFDGAVAIW